ncbi:hypothetical protein SUGI_0952080 [Cryptomeria japonica]|nr:hypothetical protein SUGI_0952080 [Cryptomeria japonica]
MLTLKDGSALSHKFHKSRFSKSIVRKIIAHKGTVVTFSMMIRGGLERAWPSAWGPPAAMWLGMYLLLPTVGEVETVVVQMGCLRGPCIGRLGFATKETTGHCSFGNKCHFAHSVTNIQKYGGVFISSDALH